MSSLPHYKVHKFVIKIMTLSGLYFPSIEKIWPRKYVKIAKFLSFVSAAIVPTYIFFSIKYFLFEEPDIYSQLFMGLLLVTAFFSAGLTWYFLYCRHDFVNVFEYWDKSFQEDLYNDERLELLSKRKKDGERTMKFFGSIILSLTIFYFIISFLDPEKKIDHPTVFKYNHQSPDFELVVAYESTCLLFGISIITTFDSLILTLVSLEQVQLLHLKESLGKIVDSFIITKDEKLIIDEIKKKTKVFEIKRAYDGLIIEQQKIFPVNEKKIDIRSEREVFKRLGDVEEKIKIWLLHHQQLLRYHDELKKIYSIPFTLKYVVFILDICLIGFLTIKEHGFTMKDNVIAVAYCITDSSFFLINTIIIDSIREAGESLFEEAFSKSWYSYPKHMQSIFQIIIAKSHQPLNFYFLKIFPISPVNFARIFSMAFSFFTYLIQVTNKDK